MVVYTGILPVAETHAGLATVMGHEIAHALAHHGAERMAQTQIAQILLGGAAGLVGAAILGWAVFQGGRRLSIQGFFAATSVLLLFLAGGLVASGVGRLQGLGVLPAGDPLWDTSWLLDDQSTVGSLLTGLVGYRARPTALEVGGYVLYVVVAGTLFFPALVRRRARRASDVREPAVNTQR